MVYKRGMHYESYQVQFNRTGVIASEEALMTEVIKSIQEGTYWQIWDPVWFHTILERIA